MEKSIDMKDLADYAVSEGMQNTEDGRWETSYEKLHNHFGVEIERGDDFIQYRITKIFVHCFLKTYTSFVPSAE